MSSRKISTTVGLGEDVLARIKDESARADRSVSFVVDLILRKHYGLASETPKDETHVKA
jgi:hypothetical protein